MSVSIHCPFCKRFTALTQVEGQVDTAKVPFQAGPAGDYWWMGQCNNCQKYVLVHQLGDIVYPNSPPSPTDVRVPESIRKDLDEAKICLAVDAYRASAVMARRAMQSACIERGAKKDKLVDQLHELADNGTITKDLKEWVDVVRWVGNDAAHPTGDEVTKDDAEDILQLAEQFVVVVYVTPAIAREWRTKHGK